MSILTTPSVVVGVHLGMHPYFTIKENDLSFKLGQDFVQLLYDKTSDADQLKITKVKDVLFADHLKAYAPAHGLIEDYLTNGTVAFSGPQTRQATNHWLSQMQAWVKQETWARQFIDYHDIIDSLQPAHASQVFRQRLFDMRNSAFRLFDKQVVELYHFHWSQIQYKLAYNQTIKPSDLEFFLSRTSFLGSLRNIVALEWIRNVKEGFTVNSDSDQELQMYSLYDAFRGP